MSKLRIASLLLVASASVAPAQNVRYQRNPEVKIEVRPERVRPAPVARVPDRPAVTAETALTLEGLEGEFQAEQEQILKQLIEDTPDRDADEKAKYYFMLGELQAKQHRYWRLRSIELSLAGKSQESAAAANEARALLVRAVATYKALTENAAFRSYPELDTALFYFAYTLQTGRYTTHAIAAYEQLLKNHPRSRWVPEAYFALAEQALEAGRHADAAARYRKVLQFPRAAVYWHASYKLGWIQFHERRYQEALETFYRVTEGTRREAKLEVLHRAARKDFVRVYAEIGKVERAYDAFRRGDRRRALEMLATLADLYLERGKNAHAVHAYQELMRRAPTHADACVWQYNIARATLTMPAAAVVREVENLVRLYAAVHRKLPAAAARECHDHAAAMSGELARAYHSEYAQTQNPATLVHAQKLYRAYLAAFPRARDHGETQYFHAELLWARATVEPQPRLQTALWEEAATAFTAVVEARTAPAKYIDEAAYAAVLAWKNALDVDPSSRRHAISAAELEREYDRVPQPQAIPAREQALLDAFRRYIEVVHEPDPDELVHMKFLEANTYRRYHHYAKAIPLFEELLARHRSHELAEAAANLLLDVHNKRRDHAAMIALVDRLAADPKFLAGKDELAGVLARLRIQHRRKQAEDLERRGRATANFQLLVACGNAYMDIYNASPEATDNDEILYNALVCFHDGKSVGAAITAFGALQRFYPSSRLMPRAVGRIGKAYGDVAFYEQAAARLEEYATKYAGEADAPRALADAVVYRKGIGDDARAIANTQRFVRMFAANQPQRAAEAHFSLASIYEKQGNHDALVRHLREYLRRFGARGGAERVVIAHAKIGQALWARSCPVKLVDGACVKVTRERAIHVRRLARGAQPTQCGPTSKAKLTVVPRSAREAGAAMAAFADAVRAFERLAPTERGARHYYAQARLAQADRDFEAYLSEAFPHGLDFDPARPAIATRSTRRLERWIGDKTRVGARATAQYERVLAIQDPASSITAAARIAQISQHFAHALFTAEIPRDVRTGPFADDKVAAFCDRLVEVAEPLEARALDGYRVCLSQSTRLGWFSEWSELCERELGQLRPDEYPTASELRAVPAVATVITIEPPIARLE